MTIERKDPATAGGSQQDIADFIESDFKIRSGMCPNGCGLLTWDGTFQECHKCNFVCNTRPEHTPQ